MASKFMIDFNKLLALLDKNIRLESSVQSRHAEDILQARIANLEARNAKLESHILASVIATPLAKPTFVPTVETKTVLTSAVQKSEIKRFCLHDMCWNKGIFDVTTTKGVTAGFCGRHVDDPKKTKNYTCCPFRHCIRKVLQFDQKDLLELRNFAEIKQILLSDGVILCAKHTKTCEKEAKGLVGKVGSRCKFSVTCRMPLVSKNACKAHLRHEREDGTFIEFRKRHEWDDGSITCTYEPCEVDKCGNNACCMNIAELPVCEEHRNCNSFDGSGDLATWGEEATDEQLASIRNMHASWRSSRT